MLTHRAVVSVWRCLFYSHLSDIFVCHTFASCLSFLFLEAHFYKSTRKKYKTLFSDYLYLFIIYFIHGTFITDDIIIINSLIDAKRLINFFHFQKQSIVRRVNKTESDVLIKLSKHFLIASHKWKY